MHRLLRRGVVLLGCATLASGATAAAVELGGDSATARTAVGADRPSVDDLRYWDQARVALTPLLLYVRALPASVSALERTGGAAAPSQLRQASDMAEEFATARDLVGRLPAPAAARGDVGELLQVACQLYRESALTVGQLASAPAGPAALRTLDRAQSLHDIGDRLIDQARRVLHIDAVGPEQAPVELQYAPPVPTLAEVTHAPTSARPANSGNTLGLAHTALDVLTGVGGGAPGTDRAAIARLTAASAALEANSAGQGEDVIGARLAILLGIVAADAGSAGQPHSAAALRTLSNDVWNTARTLARRDGAGLEALSAPAVPRSRVFVGGAFNGHPPALRPGDDIGAGLPGGLPRIDPLQILRG